MQTKELIYKINELLGKKERVVVAVEGIATNLIARP